ncbi:MAG: tRNA (adenosine(37)-N6)-dimethylallyltransferase MiaA [Firmicutes bacterium]|nr:tRNA (adenosine(37)-N6)-dimethylallyltransferase MiaA [Bacillota bacterium]
MRVLLALAGPTAVGKTEVSLKLAPLINAEVVCSDSRQIYKYLDIGTAKVPESRRAGIPHHLLDIALPDEKITLSDYQQKAYAAINEIFDKGRIALMVGGTGLYIKAVTEGYELPFAPPQKDFREKCSEEVKKQGTLHLHQRLAEVDAESAGKIHPNDARRIIRALEVYQFTGKPLSSYTFKEVNPLNARILKICLSMDRKRLYQKINDRVLKMVEKGLVEEVKKVLDMGYENSLMEMKVMGYHEFIPYFQGKISLDEAIARFQKDTRNYAKRQITWFRADKEIIWVDLDKFSGIEEAVKRIKEIVDENIK